MSKLRYLPLEESLHVDNLKLSWAITNLNDIAGDDSIELDALIQAARTAALNLRQAIVSRIVEEEREESCPHG